MRDTKHDKVRNRKTWRVLDILQELISNENKSKKKLHKIIPLKEYEMKDMAMRLNAASLTLANNGACS